MEKKFENQEMNWHACPHETVLQNLQSSKDGLSHKEAEIRLRGCLKIKI